MLCNTLQVVPDEMVQMAERYESWRERKENERGEGRGGGGFGEWGGVEVGDGEEVVVEGIVT